MIEVAFWLAMAVACFGTLSRDQASSALLASAAICVLADEAGVEFYKPVWLLIDVIVIAVVLRRNMPWKDIIAMILFLPAWVLYYGPYEELYNGVMVIVILQMLVVFPARKFVERFKKARHASALDYFDMRVRHASA